MQSDSTTHCNFSTQRREGGDRGLQRPSLPKRADGFILESRKGERKSDITFERGGWKVREPGCLCICQPGEALFPSAGGMSTLGRHSLALHGQWYTTGDGLSYIFHGL